MTAASTPAADAADWTLTVPARHVQPDGTAVTVCNLVDDVSGEVGTVTITLTADRRLTCSVAGLTLADFQAWSDQ